MKAFKRLRMSETGAELVEFALIFPTLLLMLGGMMDLGFLFQRYEVVTNAAREGARLAVLPNYADADVTARVNAYLTASGLTDPATVTVSPPQTVALGSRCISVRPVTVSYNSRLFILGPVFGLMGGSTSKTLTARTAMRSEIAAVGCP